MYGRKSDHIVVPGLGRPGQVGQGDFVQIIPDDLVQAAPHLIGAALGQAAAGRCTRFQTGDRGQIPLGQKQDIADPVLIGGTGQAIAAALAPQPLQKTVLDQGF